MSGKDEDEDTQVRIQNEGGDGGMWTVIFNLPPLEILTKDSVTVTLDAVVHFKIHDPMASVVKVTNASQVISTELRNLLGTKNLHVNIRRQQQHRFTSYIFISNLGCSVLHR